MNARGLPTALHYYPSLVLVREGGYPCLGLGSHPCPLSPPWWTYKQTENITSRPTSYAVGNKLKQNKWKCNSETDWTGIFFFVCDSKERLWWWVCCREQQLCTFCALQRTCLRWKDSISNSGRTTTQPSTIHWLVSPWESSVKKHIETNVRLQ